MFIREKKNSSGSVSVQVLQKVGRQNRLLKTIGCTKDASELLGLRQLARDYISSQTGQLSLSLDSEPSQNWYDQTLSSIESIELLGPSLILGKLFDQIGFNKIEKPIFRDLVLSRIIYPFSKLKTCRYLSEYQSKHYQVDKLYRYMDRLADKHQKQVEQISYEHSLKILGGKMSIVFYDVTTIYFESDKEDELRKSGFSKDGKHKHPQIVFGLLVSLGGYPMAYQIFEGNQYEGHTMLPVIEAFKKRFNLEKMVIVADSGLMNNDNIEELQSKGYQFVIGARIKNESKTIQSQILALKLEEGKTGQIQKTKEHRLIISNSARRAAKDKNNRKRGLERLEKSLKKGKLTKSNINNRGYNKYLKMQGNIDISIDYDKFDKDAQWDGLKGYLTNTKLKPKQLIDQYNELWKIEKAFRIAKTDLRIRPVYHRLQKRIKAHICISFVAYKIYKELERQLDLGNNQISVQRAIEIIKTIYGIRLKHPSTKKQKMMLFAKTEQQKILLDFFEIHLG